MLVFSQGIVAEFNNDTLGAFCDPWLSLSVTPVLEDLCTSMATSRDDTRLEGKLICKF